MSKRERAAVSKDARKDLRKDNHLPELCERHLQLRSERVKLQRRAEALQSEQRAVDREIRAKMDGAAHAKAVGFLLDDKHIDNKGWIVKPFSYKVLNIKREGDNSISPPHNSIQ